MKIKKDFILREVNGINVVVAVGSAVKEFNGLITLNETGAFLWKQLEKDVDEKVLLNSLLNEYEVEEDVAKTDVKAFIEKLTEAKLLEQ